ncbi:hypothetical protein BDV38DRAFT_239363 [Aspergillus pseudotamarii]|uniref:Secreted protein n=1 Tax=Aspergillus pseudotamarii TaxID=132259 RepID=A0A5N6T387_ASPPS|nr:uncharacterized protein BDV38DRAFT_239363 [Aspergillus pseudotamarii]KAE8140772.1 hypothetical protein BDV38DRAFT_239363 [Aspergillus pseudotamarii]
MMMMMMMTRMGLSKVWMSLWQLVVVRRSRPSNSEQSKGHKSKDLTILYSNTNSLDSNSQDSKSQSPRGMSCNS